MSLQGIDHVALFRSLAANDNNQPTLPSARRKKSQRMRTMMKLSSIIVGTFARFPHLPAIAAMSAASFAVMFTACSASAAEPTELPSYQQQVDAPPAAQKLGKDGESRVAAHASAIAFISTSCCEAVK